MNNTNPRKKKEKKKIVISSSSRNSSAGESEEEVRTINTRGKGRAKKLKLSEKKCFRKNHDSSEGEQEEVSKVPTTRTNLIEKKVLV